MGTEIANELIVCFFGAFSFKIKKKDLGIFEMLLNICQLTPLKISGDLHHHHP